MRRKTKSLKKKIILHLFLITFLVFISTEAYLLFRSHRAINQLLDKSLLARAEGLASITRMKPDGKIAFDFTDRLMPDYGGPDPHAYFLILRRNDNSEIERSASLKGIKFTLPKKLRALPPRKPFFGYHRLNGKLIRFICLRGVSRRETEDEKSSEQDKLFFHKRPRGLKSEGKLIPECLFIVGINTRDANEDFWETAQRTSTALGIGLIVLLLASGAVIFRSLKPLSILQREVRSITASNLVPVTVPEVREIANVAGTLNDAIRRLKEAFARERRFTADVAHELRTPVSEILSLAEVSLRWGDDLDEQNRKNYRDFLDAARQMQKIVTTLLALARYDSGVLKEQKEEVRLESFIPPLWEQFKEKAAARGINCRADIPPDTTIFIDKSLIRTILENLFSNAIDYTPPGGIIEWKAAGRGGRFYFSISNNVTDLKPDDLPHLFNRFWRKDPARASDTHSGLGLSLVKALAEVSGFSITARLSRPDLLTIVLQRTLNVSAGHDV